jgi:DNA-binding transcriptional LysR family regulator
MEFRQLEIFVAVVETGSFSRAGERLHLSQPAVTAHINGLEEELEQQLLIRDKQGVRLTSGGKTLFDYALSALNQREETLVSLMKGRTDAGQLRIAASSVPAQYLLPGLLVNFRRFHQDVRINLIFCDSIEVGRKLNNQQADIGFSGSRSFGAECDYQPIATDRLVVITPVSDPYCRLTNDGCFPVERLVNDPMIMRESGSGTRREFMNYLQELTPGAEPNIVAVMEDYLAIKNAVAADMGIAIMSERSVEDYVRLGYVLSFPLGDSAVRKLYILKRKKFRLLGTVKKFYQFALDHSEMNKE